MLAMSIEITPDRYGFRSFGKLILVAAVLAASIGCGEPSEPTAHLAGKVTLSGKPIPFDAEASITFVPEATASNAKKIIVPINVSDGQYDSLHTPQGNVRAYFSIARKGPKTISERTGQEYQEEINLVPGEYSTGILLQVNGENTAHNFEL